ncbi:MAG: glycosyltransferase [Bacteroidia bacterium]|nr:glycosyltransferase [Bacteroidia bacterium]
MKTDSPFFSIILPTYNRADFLPKAVESVLSQKYEDYELIIIDDASTDNTSILIDKYSDVRIRYLINEKNIERSASRNKGIREAKGKYICFLDSDDYYLDNHLKVLEHEISCRQQPTAFLFTHGFLYKNNEEQKLIFPFNVEHKNNVELIYNSEFYINNVCIHRNILEQHKFNVKIKVGEDSELWLRIAAEEYPIFPINQYTTVIVLHEDNSTNIKNNYGLYKLQGLKYRYENPKLRKFFTKSLIRKQHAECYFLMAKYYHEKKIYLRLLLAVFNCLFLYPYHPQRKALIGMLLLKI